MALSWQGKHVLIAGGSSGLGLALVRCLSSRGAQLTIIGRDETRLGQAATIAKELGGSDIETICADVCIEESIQVSLTRFTSGEKKLDLAINAIGQSDRGHLLQDPTFSRRL